MTKHFTFYPQFSFKYIQHLYKTHYYHHQFTNGNADTEVKLPKIKQVSKKLHQFLFATPLIIEGQSSSRRLVGVMPHSIC